jgi:transcriptional regulator with XRE-family HTH domain
MSKTDANKTSANPEDHLKAIGRKLKAVRESRGISIAEAADYLRMSTARLEGIERGEKHFALTLLVAMCHYYQASVLKIVR